MITTPDETAGRAANAQAALSVRFADAGRACVVFRGDRGEGPRTGAIPTLVGALLASALARMGDGERARQMLVAVERTAGAFAGMAQPNVLPHGLKLVEPDELPEARTVCTILIPADGQAFVRSVFAAEDPDVAYRAFLYALQFGIESLPPESLVAMSSVLRGVVQYFEAAAPWPDPITIERELAAGKAGIAGR